MPNVELKPVIDPKDGSVQLYDIFIDGRWIGSRRTTQQCDDAIKFETRQ